MKEVSEVKEALPKTEPRRMTMERTQREYEYTLAQQLSEKLLSAGLISVDEFHNLSALNREKFSPYLAELMG